MRRPGLAFAFAVPIAILGGLIGLGGAEFRLPVLAGPLRYTARQAVPLNLAVSLVTLVTALVTRAGSLSLHPLAPFLPAVPAVIVGAPIHAVGLPPVPRPPRLAGRPPRRPMRRRLPPRPYPRRRLL